MTELIETPRHRLTVEEWDAIPETDASKRYELVDGVVVVMASALALHQLAVLRLANVLNERLPAELMALPGGEVGIDLRYPATVRVPDIVVVPTERVRTNPRRFDPQDVTLAVEVVSPSGRRTDRVTKLAEYERAGIASYWIVDLDADGADRFVAYDLDGGGTGAARYVESVRGSGAVKVSRPVPMVIDLDSMMALG